MFSKYTNINLYIGFKIIQQITQKQKKLAHKIQLDGNSSTIFFALLLLIKSH